ncbi:hypothetical protein DFS34DRAFT_460047 [Phlyctochytrium arcticum]|nr:hypothetical protein DFS34DRAFT_460047 [Phlyctochytrium arcticum]
MEWLFTYIACRLPKATRVLRNPTRLIVFRGKILEEELKANRLIVDDVYGALRKAGHAGLSNVEAVFIEPTGIFSVITKDVVSAAGEDLSALTINEHYNLCEWKSSKKVEGALLSEGLEIPNQGVS